MMAEMSPGDKWLLGGGNGRKWGYLKMAKILFFVISAVVFVVIFYTNTSIMGGHRRSSLLALFDLSALGEKSAQTIQRTAAAPLIGGGASKSPELHMNRSHQVNNRRRRLHHSSSSSSTLSQSSPQSQSDSSWNPINDIDSSEYPSWGDTEPLIMSSWIMRPPVSTSEKHHQSTHGGHSHGRRPEPIQLFNRSHQEANNNNNSNSNNNINWLDSDYNIFVIYTKENYQLHVKFELFARSLLKYSKDELENTKKNMPLHLHILTDENSAHSIVQMLEVAVRRYRRSIIYTLYNMRLCAERVTSIVAAMTPFFSSTPKSYYSDALFYISLGLHRIADRKLDRVLLLDCDVVFRTDVRLLFEEFQHFQSEQLFGLAPELTPVYRHILYRYRAMYPRTDFGSPFYYYSAQQTSISRMMKLKASSKHHRLGDDDGIGIKGNRSQSINHHGYPGLNSGVILLQLKRMRHSRFYQEQLKEPAVRQLTSKYMFKGHLGDQDFFTLLGYEYPALIYRLDCVWNRQLCTWWKDHGYGDVFDRYFTCKGHVKMYHGNCNARVPEL